MAEPRVLDPEVEEATQAALGHREAYAARLSTATRNPHSAKKGRSLAQLAKLSPEERVFVQWRTAFGCPISDEAKAQFTIACLGHEFILADVRLWLEKHQQKGGKELNTRLVHLEFFFDGQLAEIAEDPAVFNKAFEDMIESQLQARRVTEFRKKLLARKRTGGTRSASANAQPSGEDAEGGGSGCCAEEDSAWQTYLKKPVQPTELSLRATREAGCMLRFLVCQTSLSVSAAEELGQIAFQEHFPIDGKAQAPEVSTKPLPRWAYWMVICTVIFTLVTLFIFIRVFKGVFSASPPQLPPLAMQPP